MDYALPLAAITFAAAIVNGALGYGFSSITVPLALLFLTNRVLNPALVPIEVALNAYVLWVNRAALPNVWQRVLPIVIGLAPGVLIGTALDELERRNLGTALVTMCIGGGMGIATIIERV